MADMTAIDIPIDPDDAALARARKVNARVLESMPEGWVRTAAAFVADPGETISPTIIDRVEAYVPNQIGDGKYLPHITVGVAKFDDLRVIGAEPFDAFAVHPSSVSVYHLGSNGTARKLLKGWPVNGS
ncbi:MAG: hypothetical protein ACLPY3_04895 [Solirubrobacteraceae bacterium]